MIKVYNKQSRLQWQECYFELHYGVGGQSVECDCQGIHQAKHGLDERHGEQRSEAGSGL